MKSPIYAYRAQLRRVIDGDTFEFFVDLGFEVWRIVTVRLRGVFAAESHESGGLTATQRAEAALSAAKDIIIVTQKNRLNKDVTSFTRYVADVWVDGALLADLLVQEPAGIGATKANPA